VLYSRSLRARVYNIYIDVIHYYVDTPGYSYNPWSFLEMITTCLALSPIVLNERQKRAVQDVYRILSIHIMTYLVRFWHSVANTQVCTL